MLSETFRKLREKREVALILFVTAGDPDIEELPVILDTLEGAGADIIEVGLPFSDPIADGPTIQAASQRALDRGVTPSSAMGAIARRSGTVPVVLMGYYNTALARGLGTFAGEARSCGASGVILSDLTPEEAAEWTGVAHNSGLDTIFLAAPTSTEDRLNEIAKRSSGFVYAVSRTGVTGAGDTISADISGLVAKIRTHSELPVCVGFGISNPEHVALVANDADGVIVGSWLVDKLANCWNSRAGRDKLQQEIRALKSATRKG